MTTTPGEVFVGDVGTVYYVPTYDNDMAAANFDPSAATVKRLTFRMPGATGLCVRAATAIQVAIAGVQTWCLSYTVTAADVAAWASASAGGFHLEAGLVSLQAYVEFSSAQKWHSSWVETDQQGRRLKVAANLSL